ncbi:hypothetical protein KPNJ1_01984 [Klebsiella pneumoniae 30660/NJST258_1]|uniref:Uncharacterized protein n=1 Tax=Klebsiella pneumoniae 30684/NJST258_2 TaxID=1420013 RepID=W8VFU3_KLEPN|nr:hypothetical protein KPNJ2_01946 [Klebsiella pneumoniae 30684/NJST258_2]AHM84390.1 hypothetical protein KPNJ1_01984 [Klebsiella pneumoniae 30660/NJST258_1]
MQIIIRRIIHYGNLFFVNVNIQGIINPACDI